MTHFQCPYCNHDQIVTSSQRDNRLVRIDIENAKYGAVAMTLLVTSCANPQCREISIDGGFCTTATSASGLRVKDRLQEWNLRPSTTAKPQPDAVPAAIASDYYESCAIQRLSPKASATLSRRCIQGMIRDFCKINEKTLYAEIEKLGKQVENGQAEQGVTEDTIAAIHAVRSIGNIGAHMETDINVIVDVDEGEAQALIELIELLFEDWYIARDQRKQRLTRVQSIAQTKKALLSAAPADDHLQLSNLGSVDDQ